MNEAMNALQAGNAHAAESLFRFLQRPLFSYLFRLCGNRELSEDLLQETFFSIFNRAETFSPGNPVRPWAYMIARNKFLEWQRRQSKIVHLNLHPKKLVSLHPGPDAQVMANTHVQSVMSELSPEIREAFILKHFQRLTFREVAEVQEIPVPTAKSRVLFAAKKIREFMEGTS